jgi:quercetin dioxygenase-like cupin family protein
MAQDGHLTDPDPSVTARVARFSELQPLPHMARSGLPLAALDLLYARTILPVITDKDETVVAAGAPITGGGMTMVFTVCPPGQGPGLHRHSATYETFVVLDGAFEYSWGRKGDHRVVLGKYDTVSFPPGVYRAFRAVGETDGTMLVIITGDDQDDIVGAAAVGQQLDQLGCRAGAEAIGFRFDGLPDDL